MSIELVCSWDANPAAEQVTNYNVYLDGALVGGSASLGCTIFEIAPGPHTVEVSAVNSTAEGPKSDPVTVNVLAVPGRVVNVQVHVTVVVH